MFGASFFWGRLVCWGSPVRLACPSCVCWIWRTLLGACALAARDGGGMGLASLGEWTGVDFFWVVCVWLFLSSSLGPFNFFWGGRVSFFWYILVASKQSETAARDSEFFLYFVVCDSFY